MIRIWKHNLGLIMIKFRAMSGVKKKEKYLAYDVEVIIRDGKCTKDCIYYDSVLVDS